jgi:hypothetical protein
VYEAFRGYFLEYSGDSLFDVGSYGKEARMQEVEGFIEVAEEMKCKEY